MHKWRTGYKQIPLEYRVFYGTPVMPTRLFFLAELQAFYMAGNARLGWLARLRDVLHGMAPK